MIAKRKSTTLASVLQTARTRFFSLRLSGRRTRLAPHVWQPNFTHALHLYRARPEAKARLPTAIYEHFGQGPLLCASLMDANAAPPEPPAGAEAATQPSDANATPPAPPQPFGELLETVREERQQDRKIRLMETFRSWRFQDPCEDVVACGTKGGYGSA